MRLAVVTERVDLDADITGFTHRWWERLAARVEHLHVLAQGTGRTALPPNVTLHDLGKDRGAGAARRAWRLAAIVRRLGRGPERIDAVLAHMAPQYAILAWPPAALHGVPVLLWFTHGSVDLRLRVAHALVTRVVTASRLSFRIASRKVEVVGHGIDGEQFRPEGLAAMHAPTPPRGTLRLLTIGRLSPRKRLETVLEAVARLAPGEEPVAGPGGEPPPAPRDVHLSIVGAPGTPEQEGYAQRLRARCEQDDLHGRVTFAGSLPYDGIERVHRGADVFVSASATGSVDKVVLEAMACGRPIVTSNEAFGEVLGPLASKCLVPAGDPAALADRLAAMRDLGPGGRAALGRELREIVLRDHDLERLMDRLVAVVESCR